MRRWTRLDLWLPTSGEWIKNRLIFIFIPVQSECNFYDFSWKKEFMEARLPLVLDSHRVSLGKA